jgi:hypothetical protein
MRLALLLRKLLACERGLVDAYGDALRRGGHSLAEMELMTRAVQAHQMHAQLLGERVRVLGEEPPENRDDLWINETRDLRGLMYAEQTSHDTYHDALLDFPEEFAQTDAERIVKDHRELMRAWEELLASSAEPSVTL